MKTIQELYNEVMGSQELKAQFIESTKAGKLIDFLKDHGLQHFDNWVAVVTHPKGQPFYD